jgi:hypothetical protein
MDTQKTNNATKKRRSTIGWLSYHTDKTTGEPFLTDANQSAAERFSILCEKMLHNYRMSQWEDYVDGGHLNEPIFADNARKILHKALKALGDDAALTADIVIKNYSLPMAEKKHKISRGKGKIVLRQALDRLADLFGLRAGCHGFYPDVH